ncbi:MAG: DUF6510 family protein [Gemmatimonadaceae bacterium]
MHSEDMHLDGNAAGGTLREIFACDVTTAIATCGSCGTRGAVGALLEYGQEMGVILRCPACDAPLLRVVHTPGWLRLDASGIALLVIPDTASVVQA